MFWDHWLIIVAPKPIILRSQKGQISQKLCDENVNLFGKSHQTQ